MEQLKELDILGCHASHQRRFDVAPFRSAHPREMRRLIREEKWIYPTSGLCHCHVQANLIVLPKDWAYDFLVFAQRNPKPCPILDVTEPGDGEAKLIAPGSDVRTDIPRYRVWKGGELIDEPTSVAKYWREDLVAFLLGCSFSFEGGVAGSGDPHPSHRHELQRAHVRHQHSEQAGGTSLGADGGQHAPGKARAGT